MFLLTGVCVEMDGNVQDMYGKGGVCPGVRRLEISDTGRGGRSGLSPDGTGVP